MRCVSCGGSAHPASGCQYSEDVIVCGRCVREFWEWVQGHTNMMKSVGRKPTQEERKIRPRPVRQLVSFYEAAGKVIDSGHGRDERRADLTDVEPR